MQGGGNVARNEKYQRAFNAYIGSSGSLSATEIAECAGVTQQTVKRWCKNNDWEGTLTALSDKNGICDVAELLPMQTAQILRVIKTSTSEEILWQNRLLQYAAIIRAQHLMDVESKDILSLEKQRSGEQGSESAEWENHTPWERYKIFLETQSKAMNSLTMMLKRFNEYKHDELANDELKAKTELIKQRVESIKLQDDDLTVICNLPEKPSGDLEK